MSDFNLNDYRKLLKDTIYYAAFRTVDGESGDKFTKSLDSLIEIGKANSSEIPNEDLALVTNLVAVFRLDQFINLGINHIYTHFTKVPLGPNGAPVPTATVEDIKKVTPEVVPNCQ